MRTTPRPRPEFDLAPPQAADEEQALVGAVILEPRLIDEALLEVEPVDIFDEGHRAIYEAVIELRENGKKIDALTIKALLANRGVFDVIGGAAFLAKCVNATPNAAHWAYYAKTIKEASRRRRLMAIGQSLIEDAQDIKHDIAAIEASAGESITAAMEKGVRRSAEKIGGTLEALSNEILTGNYAKRSGLPTGFPTLDRKIGGLFGGNLITIGARPGIGKSAFALQVASHVAIDLETPVAFFSLEMLRDEICERVLSQQGRIDRRDFVSLSQDDRRKIGHAFSRAGDAPLFVDDTASLRVNEIASSVRALHRRHGLGLVVIDYLQLIEADDPKQTRQAQIGRMSRRLKQLAMDTRLPIMVLSQLNREADGEKPSLKHLRESGDIEQDSNVVGLLWSDKPAPKKKGRFDPDEEERPTIGGLGVNFVDQTGEPMKFSIAKNRSGPKGFDIDLWFFEKDCRFGEQATDDQSEFF